VAETPEIKPPDIKVRLKATEDGSLAGIWLGGDRGTYLGNDEAAFDRLNNHILELTQAGKSAFAEDIAVKLDTDYNLHYRHIIKAVSSCTGKLVERPDGTKELQRYVQKIEFEPPRRPAE
jgi:hypothetical protein